jgi:hypothetical protein
MHGWREQTTKADAVTDEELRLLEKTASLVHDLPEMNVKGDFHFFCNARETELRLLVHQLLIEKSEDIVYGFDEYLLGFSIGV